MYYESIRTLVEVEFKNHNFAEEQKYQALDLLNKLADHFDQLTGSKTIYIVAALAFFALEASGEARSFKQLADDFGLEAKTLALKVKEIIPFLDMPEPEDILKKGLIIIPEPKKAREKNTAESGFKGKPLTTITKELQDNELIEMLKQFKSFAAILFKEKDFMEIKQFIKLLELNLYMAGYDIRKTELEKKFGELFVHLGFEPKKGREAEKFVSLKDRFGQAEPYTLIRLGD